MRYTLSVTVSEFIFQKAGELLPCARELCADGGGLFLKQRADFLRRIAFVVKKVDHGAVLRRQAFQRLVQLQHFRCGKRHGAVRLLRLAQEFFGKVGFGAVDCHAQQPCLAVLLVLESRCAPDITQKNLLKDIVCIGWIADISLGQPVDHVAILDEDAVEVLAGVILHVLASSLWFVKNMLFIKNTLQNRKLLQGWKIFWKNGRSRPQ